MSGERAETEIENERKFPGCSAASCRKTPMERKSESENERRASRERVRERERPTKLSRQFGRDKQAGIHRVKKVGPDYLIRCLFNPNGTKHRTPYY